MSDVYCCYGEFVYLWQVFPPNYLFQNMDKVNGTLRERKTSTMVYKWKGWHICNVNMTIDLYNIKQRNAHFLN